MAKRQIKDYINELKVINPHINPNDLQVGTEYHVPPIISIERMDVLITSNGEGNEIGFKIVDSKDENEKTMDKTSILTKFLVPRKTF